MKTTKRESPNLQSILVKVLDERAPMKAGAKRSMSKREAILRNLIAKAKEGHSQAIKLVLEFIAKHPEAPQDDGSCLIDFSETARLFGIEL